MDYAYMYLHFEKNFWSVWVKSYQNCNRFLWKCDKQYSKKKKKPSLKIASNKLFSCVQTFIVDIFNQVGCLLLTYLNISKVGAFVKDWK